MTTLDHLHHLAEIIGPRGSTTPQEAEAARYAAQVLREAGLEPTTETFTSARSSYYPYALFAGLVLASEVVFWLGGQRGAIIALGLTLLATVSLLMEMTFRPNLYYWLLPKGESQNVWARLHSNAEPRQQVVLIGHLDSHRTPLVFSSDRWVKLLGILTPLALVSTLILLVLFAVGISSPDRQWQFLSIPSTLFVLGLFLLLAQADFSGYSPGANDNASGVAVVLSTAERLSREPLTHTAVWVVFTGCEEVGCYGADAFARAHHDEFDNSIWIAVDTVGGIGASVAYLTSEQFLLTVRSDPDLIALADQIASQHPELDAIPHQFKSTYTEGAIGAKWGFRVLSLVGFRRDGVLPEWHRPTDVVSNLDTAVVERAETFLWRVLRAIGQQV